MMKAIAMLNEVHWGNLRHAYGFAEDIPALLSSLTADDASQRARAQDLLYLGAFHQGDATPVLPYIIRFLVLLLDEPNIPDQAWVIEYLARAAAMCDGCVEIDVDSLPESLHKQVSEQAKPEYNTKQLVCRELHAGKTTYQKRLFVSQAEERVSLYGLISRLGCEDDAVSALFEERLAIEDSEDVAASLVFCLAHISDSTNVKIEQLLTAYLFRDERPLVEIAAGIGLVNRFRANLSPHAITQLAMLIEKFPSAVIRLNDIYHKQLHTLANAWVDDDLFSSFRWVKLPERTLLLNALHSLLHYMAVHKLPGVSRLDGVIKQIRKTSAT